MSPPRYRPPRRWIREIGIAIPTLLGTLIFLGLANQVYELFWSREALTPEGLRNMSFSRHYAAVGTWLVLAVTIAPVAEEVFFRGFLYNAFRKRMPLLVALVLQSLIFGFMHFYTPLQNSFIVLIGIILGLVYEWRKTLLAPILVHFGINFLFALAMASQMYLQTNAPVLGVELAPDPESCTVADVTPGLGADTAGMEAGDIITSFEGKPIQDTRDLLEEIRYCRPGDTVSVDVRRDGMDLEFTVVLRAREGP